MYRIVRLLRTMAFTEDKSEPFSRLRWQTGQIYEVISAKLSKLATSQHHIFSPGTENKL